MKLDKMSILLVEDNLPDARFVKETLPPGQYDVNLVTNLSQAQEQIDLHAFGLVLLDLSLPDSNGLETFQSLSARLPATPIIILTGCDDEVLAVEAVKLGAQDYILKKDISEYALGRAIRYARERKLFDENSKRLAILEQHEEFMATLTHDLKNPLIGANRVLELMAQQALGTDPTEQAQLLLQLRDSNSLLLSMIQNLIEVYRFEKEADQVSLEHTDLHKIIKSCLADIAPIALHREINLKTEFSENVRGVWTDKSAMRRVMQNLLDNALKFTPNGGQINLEVRPNNGSVVVEIQDTGPGISEEEQMHLFKRFAQGRMGKKYTPGTGLGLYLCRKLVEASNGQIICISSEGVGTTFRITLPAA